MTSDEPGVVDFGAVDFAWPSVSDTLYSSATNWPSRVFLDWVSGQEPMRAIAFRDAAAVLAEKVATRGPNRPELDLLAFPFLFCWRHYVELELKQLGWRARQLLGEPDREEKLHHRLGDLWTECRGLLERIDDRSRDDYENAGRLILELDGLDPNGQHFRYARTRVTKAKGVTRTPSTPTLVGVNELGLDTIHTALTGLAGFLEAAEAQVGDLISAAPDASEW